MSSNRFQKIDDLNKAIENVRELAINTLSTLDEQIDVITQQKVDDICIRLSVSVSEQLDTLRSGTIDFLHDSYIKSNEIISTFQPIINADLTDLASVISVVGKIIAVLSGPYQTAIEFTQELAPKLITLTENIASLLAIPSYLPKIDNINFDKLNITMKPITIDDVISGAK